MAGTPLGRLTVFRKGDRGRLMDEVVTNDRSWIEALDQAEEKEDNEKRADGTFYLLMCCP